MFYIRRSRSPPVSLHPSPPAPLTGPPSVTLCACAAAVLAVGVFASFALVAMVSKRREWIFLGGFLATMSWGLLMASVLRLFLPIPAFDLVHAFIGLGVASLYIVFDIQVAVERAVSQVEPDFLLDALHLHLDLIKVFIEILRILAIFSKKDKDEKKRERK